jgi:arylsulfatase A-like enzyme
MNMKPTFTLALLLFAFIGVHASDRKPNIVIILADDMGYGDVGCYSPESKIETPNMDKLAARGIRFTDAHSPSSLCTPSRYGLLTGSYCWRTRLKKGVIVGYDETPLIEKGQTTLGSMLHDRGYETACVGKWHLGMTWPTRDGYVIQNDNDQWQESGGVFSENEKHIDFSRPIIAGPLDVGFDYFFGTLGCSTSDPPYCFIENRQTVSIPTLMSPAEMAGLQGFALGLMADDWSEETVDISFTDKAIGFMERHLETKPQEPFFLYLALSSPHNPFLPPDLTKGTTDEGPRGDLVALVDFSVARIVEFLDKMNISDETLLILTSDNGPMRGGNGHKSAGDFRGYKANIWEGGHRVPFIASFPGVIDPGTVSNETISLTDMLATLDGLTLQGVTTTGSTDGYDVWPAFLGKKISESNTFARVFHSGSGVFSLRQEQWKLIEGTRGSGSGNWTANPDSIRSTGQLYDMQIDPYERNNLWDSEPAKVLELSTKLEKIRKH